DDRHPKHRAKKTPRPVPVPPELVRLLRAHLDRFGTSPDGRLFRGARGAMLSESSYGRIWRQVREKALTSAQARSPLAARPYDLRHEGLCALGGGVRGWMRSAKCGVVAALDAARVYSLPRSLGNSRAGRALGPGGNAHLGASELRAASEIDLAAGEVRGGEAAQDSVHTRKVTRREGSVQACIGDLG